jgi:hypothetical protein
MLADFQQAMADLTASPALCNEVRHDAGVLGRRYDLTPREARRLAAIVDHPGMECACIVYRANRLAPLALNLPRTCRALGPALRDIASDYWAAYPEGNVHFYIEAERFCRHVDEQIARGWRPPAGLVEVMRDEAAIIAAALAESRFEATAQARNDAASLLV